MTLIVDRIGIIDQSAFLDHGRDGLVDHRTRDSILEKRFFDRLLSESILISEPIGGSDITGDCLIGALLEGGICLFGLFSRQALIEGIDLGGFEKSEFDEGAESS